MTTDNESPRATRYVRLSDTDLSFAYHSGRSGDVVQFAPWQVRQHTSLSVNLREARDTEALLSLMAPRTEVLLSTAVTVVPLADFTEETCESLLRFVMPEKAGERVFYDTLPAANCVLIYSMAEDTCQALEESFGEVHFSACLTHVLRHHARTYLQEDGRRRMLIHLHETAADIAVFEGLRLLAVNTFEVRQASDVAYFAYHLASTLGLDAQRDSIDLCGNDTLTEEALRTIRLFSPQASPKEQSGNMPFDLACATASV